METMYGMVTSGRVMLDIEEHGKQQCDGQASVNNISFVVVSDARPSSQLDRPPTWCIDHMDPASDSPHGEQGRSFSSHVNILQGGNLTKGEI